jgi:ribosomal protein S18 acetylase RimI-like enzyme
MDTATLRCLPDAIYSEIFTRLAERQGAARGSEPGFSWTDSPHAVWGRACFDLDISGDDALSALAAKSRELGCRIMTGPAAKPEAVEPLLEAAGFIRSLEATGMVLEKSEFRPRPSPAGLAIAEISDAEDWREWSGIVCRNLFHKESEEDAQGFSEIGKALGSGPGFRAFLGRDETGKAVATSACLDCANLTGGVFFVATEKDARKRGYGAALTARASVACFESGFRYATLSATEDGKPVYQGLGYRVVSIIGRYLSPQA